MGLRGFFLLVLLVAGLEHGPARAQEPSDTLGAILTIDQERLFTNSLFGERVAAEIAVETKTLQQEFKKLESDLTAEEQDLTEKRAGMDSEEFRNLADAFDTKVQEIRRAQDAKVRDLERRMTEQRAVFFNLILPILGELMEERGAAIVLERRMVFAVATSVDITDEALRRIDATLGDGQTQDGAVQE